MKIYYSWYKFAVVQQFIETSISLQQQQIKEIKKCINLQGKISIYPID
jgi:hypothetical protein